MENDPGNAVSMLSILKWIGGVFATFVVGFSIHSVNGFRKRIKDIEDRVITQERDLAIDTKSFADYQTYRDKKDDELNELLGEIKQNISQLFDRMGTLKDDFNAKIDGLQNSFGEKMETLNATVADLRVDNARNKGSNK